MVELLVTYLELIAPPAGAPLPAPSLAVGIERETPDIAEYLDAYRTIGQTFDWDSRLRMPPAELARWLAAESSEIYVLRESGDILGFCEFECVDRRQIELVHFGLKPSAYGRGLGRYLLDHALRACWAGAKPERIWLHTDTNDHPNALAVYTRAGFRPYLTRVERFDD